MTANLTPETLRELILGLTYGDDDPPRKKGIACADAWEQTIEARNQLSAALSVRDAQLAALQRRVEAAERIVPIARRMAELEPEAMRGVNFLELRNLWAELVAALAEEKR